MKFKSAIVGIGNTLLGDDGLGIRVCEALQKTMANEADFVQTEEMGLSLLDFISGYDRVIIIDCIETGLKDPGSIHVIPIENFFTTKTRSNHYVGLPEVAAIAREMNIPFPRELTVIGIEVKDPYLITETLSKTIREKWQSILEVVGSKVNQILSQTIRTHA